MYCSLIGFDYSDVVTVSEVLQCASDGTTLQWLLGCLLLGLLPSLMLVWLTWGLARLAISCLSRASDISRRL